MKELSKPTQLVSFLETNKKTEIVMVPYICGGTFTGNTSKNFCIHHCLWPLQYPYKICSRGIISPLF